MPKFTYGIPRSSSLLVNNRLKCPWSLDMDPDSSEFLVEVNSSVPQALLLLFLLFFSLYLPGDFLSLIVLAAESSFPAYKYSDGIILIYTLRNFVVLALAAESSFPAYKYIYGNILIYALSILVVNSSVPCSLPYLYRHLHSTTFDAKEPGVNTLTVVPHWATDISFSILILVDSSIPIFIFIYIFIFLFLFLPSLWYACSSHCLYLNYIDLGIFLYMFPA